MGDSCRHLGQETTTLLYPVFHEYCNMALLAEQLQHPHYRQARRSYDLMTTAATTDPPPARGYPGCPAVQNKNTARVTVTAQVRTYAPASANNPGVYEEISSSRKSIVLSVKSWSVMDTR